MNRFVSKVQIEKVMSGYKYQSIMMADECIRGLYKEHANAKTMTQGIRGTKTMTGIMSMLNAMRD